MLTKKLQLLSGNGDNSLSISSCSQPNWCWPAIQAHTPPPQSPALMLQWLAACCRSCGCCCCWLACCRFCCGCGAAAAIALSCLTYVMHYVIFHATVFGIQPTWPTAAPEKWPLLARDSIGRILALHTGEVFIFMSATGQHQLRPCHSHS